MLCLPASRPTRVSNSLQQSMLVAKVAAVRAADVGGSGKDGEHAPEQFLSHAYMRKRGKGFLASRLVTRRPRCPPHNCAATRREHDGADLPIKSLGSDDSERAPSAGHGHDMDPIQGRACGLGCNHPNSRRQLHHRGQQIFQGAEAEATRANRGDMPPTRQRHRGRSLPC